MRMILLILLMFFTAGCGESEVYKYDRCGDDDMKYNVQKIFGDTTAAWMWPTRPVAIRHVGIHDKTYFGWVDNTGKVYVASYDHDENVYDITQIHDWGVGDDHNQPALYIRKDGRIIAFAGGHNESNIPYYISTNPEDISSFGAQKTISKKPGATGYSYPQPVYLSDEDRIYLFFRRDALESEVNNAVRAWGFAISEDNGETFIEHDTLLFVENDVYSPYTVPVSNGRDTIYFARSDWKASGQSYVREDVRFVKYKAGNFYRADDSIVGSIYDLPISKNDMDIIYNSSAENRYAYISDIAIDDQERPVLVFTTLEKGTDETGDYDGSGMNYHHFAFWTGSEWVETQIVEAGGDILAPERNSHPAYNAGIMLNHSDPFEVVLGREKVFNSKKFYIELWRFNGSTFQKTEDITENIPGLPDKVFRPVIPRNYHENFKILFLGGNYTWYRSWETYLYRVYISNLKGKVTDAYVNIDGQKFVEQAYVKVNGTWEPVNEGFVY